MQKKTVRITTSRGPFHQSKPLAKGEVTKLPSELADALILRGWAEQVAKSRKEQNDEPIGAAS